MLQPLLRSDEAIAQRSWISCVQSILLEVVNFLCVYHACVTSSASSLTAVCCLLDQRVDMLDETVKSQQCAATQQSSSILQSISIKPSSCQWCPQDTVLKA